MEGAAYNLALLLAGEEVLEGVILDTHILVAVKLYSEVFLFLLEFRFLVLHEFDDFVHLLSLA